MLIESSWSSEQLHKTLGKLFFLILLLSFWISKQCADDISNVMSKSRFYPTYRLIMYPFVLGMLAEVMRLLSETNDFNNHDTARYMTASMCVTSTYDPRLCDACGWMPLI